MKYDNPKAPARTLMLAILERSVKDYNKAVEVKDKGSINRLVHWFKSETCVELLDAVKSPMSQEQFLAHIGIKE